MKGAEVPLMLDVIDFCVRIKWISYLQVFQLWNVHNEAVPISALSSEFEKENEGRRKWVIAVLIKDYEDSAMNYYKKSSKWIKHSHQDTFEGSDYHFIEPISKLDITENSPIDELDQALDELTELSEFYQRLEKKNN